MSDPERKKKMISLRLSDAEYKVLKTQYRTFGARNVSDMARLALQQIMTGTAAPQDGLSAKLTDLEDRVHNLETEITRLLEHELAKV